MWKIGVPHTTYVRSKWHVNRAFVRGATPRNIYETFRLMPTRVNASFLQAGNLAIIFYLIVKWETAKITCIFWWSLYQVLHPRRWMAKFVHFLTFTLEQGIWHVHSKLYVGVRHNQDNVWWGKTSHNLDTLLEIYGLQTRKVTCCYIRTWHIE